MADPEPKNSKGCTHLWLGLSLAFTYPGFDCGSYVLGWGSMFICRGRSPSHRSSASRSRRMGLFQLASSSAQDQSTCTCESVRVCVCVCARACARVCACARARVRTYVRACVGVCVCVGACVRACVRACGVRMVWSWNPLWDWPNGKPEANGPLNGRQTHMPVNT